MLELCVIFGGQSPEHEISRKSVTSVLNNLNKDKYNISTIGITKNGAWYLYTGDYAKIESGEWEQDTENKKKAMELVAKYEAAMDDDFNTADALAAIFELVKFVNSNAKAESSKAFLEALKQEIVTLSDICGLIVDKKAEMLDSDIEALIEERQAARKAKDFARADAIRDELLEKGIILKDTREGVQWKRA